MVFPLILHLVSYNQVKNSQTRYQLIAITKKQPPVRVNMIIKFLLCTDMKNFFTCAYLHRHTSFSTLSTPKQQDCTLEYLNRFCIVFECIMQLLCHVNKHL